jgi:hypothetical protein
VEYYIGAMELEAPAKVLDSLEKLLGEDVFFVPCEWGTKKPLVTYVERPFEATKSEAYRALFEVQEVMRVGPVLSFVISSIGTCQVRVATDGFAALKYARAICRFRTGCRHASFFAWSNVRASPSSLVLRLICFLVVVSSQ